MEARIETAMSNLEVEGWPEYFVCVGRGKFMELHDASEVCGKCQVASLSQSDQLKEPVIGRERAVLVRDQGIRGLNGDLSDRLDAPASLMADTGLGDRQPSTLCPCKV